MHNVFKKLLTYFSKENRSIVFTLFFLLAFSIGTYAFATYPGTPFYPGDTLDPGCAPGDTNCYVDFSGVLSNLSSSADPTVNDDIGDGYAVGSLWYNQTSGTLFVASDVTGGAAQWETAGGGGSGNVETINGSSIADQDIEVTSTTSITTLEIDSTTVDGTHTLKIPLINGSNYGSVLSGLLSGSDWNIFNNKLTSSLVDGKIFVGDGSNTAAAVTPSGDLTLTNTGVFTIANNAITSSKIFNGAVANEDLTNSTIVINGTTFNLGDSNTISAAPSGSAGGDLTGTYPNPTIATSAVTSTKILDGTIAAIDLASDSVTTAKILNGNVTNSKLANSTIDFNGVSYSLGGAITYNAATAVGALDGGGTASDNGLIIGTSLGTTYIYAQTASATKPGLVTTANQTWAGNKTFNGSITASGGLSAGSNRITAVATPTVATDAANKSYVDGLANGLRWKESVNAGTVSALPTNTYADGPSPGDPGVGATLTATANGSISGIAAVDGATLTTNDRLLVKNQATLAHNGIYIVTQVGVDGGGGSPYILTRCTNCDQPTEFTNAAVAILTGTVNAGTAWTQTNTVTTVGTDPIEWAQFLSNAYTGSNGIDVTGSTISLDLSAITAGSLSAAHGGTGQTSYATGDMLYASGATALTKLTVGTSGQCLTSNGSIPTWGSCSGGGIVLSDLSAAGDDNDINNLAYEQVWRWNTLDGGTGLTLSANTDAAASNTQTLLKVSLLGANATNSQTTYGADISNAHTGGGTTANVGLKVSASAGAVNTGITVAASGGSSNYALLATAGNVGIGVTTPSALFSVGSGSTSALTIDSSGNLSTSGTLISTNATDSSNISTGSIVTDGGVGIEKALYVGTTANVATSLTTPVVIGSGSADGTLTFEGNSATGNTASSPNLIFKVGNSAATTAMTILNDGKIGVGVTAPSELFSVGSGSALTINSSGNLTTSGTLVSTNATDSSSISTGSIVTDGGVGIEKALYVGTTANIAGLLTASAGATITGTTTINGSGTNNTTIGNSSGGTITIGASSGSNLALQDAQWSVTGAGAASFASLALTSQLTVPNGGTGVTSLNAYGLLFGGTTSTGAVQSLTNTSTAGQCLVSGGTSTLPSWATCPGGSVALSSLTAAGGTNTINNAGYAQTWQWNALAGAAGMKLSTSSTMATGGSTGSTGTAIASLQTLLALEMTGAHTGAVDHATTQTTYGIQILNNSSNGANNVGIKVASTGGTNNYALLVPSGGGRVGFGTTAPTAMFELTDAAVGGVSGTNAADILRVTGAKGGNSDSAAPDATGGAGGAIYLTGGEGGDRIANIRPPGVGGDINLTAGRGGTHSVGFGDGGAGGNIRITAGSGGSPSLNNTSGAGGGIFLTAGAVPDGGVLAPSAGGITLQGAAGGNTGTTASIGGTGSIITITGGNGGNGTNTGTGTGGFGGGVNITGGNGGSTASSSTTTIGTGGAVTLNGGRPGASTSTRIYKGGPVLLQTRGLDDSSNATNKGVVGINTTDPYAPLWISGGLATTASNTIGTGATDTTLLTSTANFPMTGIIIFNNTEAAVYRKNSGAGSIYLETRSAMGTTAVSTPSGSPIAYQVFTIANETSAAPLGNAPHFTVTSAGRVGIGAAAPTAHLDLALSSTSAVTTAANTLVKARVGAALTLSTGGSLTGLSVDVATNVTPGNLNVTGGLITMPTISNTGTATKTYNALTITPGSVTHSAAAGTTNWTGLNLTMPDTTQGSTSTVKATGLSITGGTVTSGTAYAITTSSTAGNVGFGTTAPTASLHVVGPAGTNVITATATAAGTGAAGGAYSFTGGAGGTGNTYGGGFTFLGGKGGTTTGSGGSGVTGGVISLTAGAGGDNTGSNFAQNGGTVDIISGAGGSASTATGSSANGGNGGLISITAGQGGTNGASGSGSPLGGGITLTGGQGGTISSGTNPRGGHITINGGAVGSGGSGGTPGYVLLQSTTGGFVGIGNASPGTLLYVGSGSTTDGNVFTIQDSDGTCAFNPESGGATITCSSDLSLKHDVQDLTIGLAEINQLRPTSFRMNVNDELHSGFIAQEIQTVFPDLVRMLPDGNLGVSEGGLMPYVVKAIQEIDVKVELLSSLNIAEENSLASLVRAYLEDAMNGLRKIFVGEVHTDRLCVGTTCVTEAQLQQLLNQQSGGTGGGAGPSGTGTTGGGASDGSGTTTGTDGSGTGSTDGSGTTSGDTGTTGTDGSGTGTTDGTGTTGSDTGTTDGTGSTTGTDGTGTGADTGSSTTGTDGGTSGSGTTDGSGTGGEGDTGV